MTLTLSIPYLPLSLKLTHIFTLPLPMPILLPSLIHHPIVFVVNHTRSHLVVIDTPGFTSNFHPHTNRPPRHRHPWPRVFYQPPPAWQRPVRHRGACGGPDARAGATDHRVHRAAQDEEDALHHCPQQGKRRRGREGGGAYRSKMSLKFVCMNIHKSGFEPGLSMCEPLTLMRVLQWPGSDRLFST